jgi:hypothetical protein
MYFFGPELSGLRDPASHEGPHKIYSAVSSDSIHFTVEPGIRFEASGITDPEVIFAQNQWFMFLSHGQETRLVRSKDGLQFTLDENTVFHEGGVPGAVLLPNGEVRIFLSSRGNIVSLKWNPAEPSYDSSAITLAVEKGDGLLVADPACIYRSNGTYYLIFKYKNQQA